MSEIHLDAFPNSSEVQNNLKRVLYVGNLDDNVTKEILEAAFIPFGDIRTIAIPKDRLTGKHRGFGFVEYEEEEDAQHSIANMHDSELYGRVLTVNLARTPAREPGKKYIPVWKDETVMQLQYNVAPENLNSGNVEEDQALEALMKCSEAQEIMERKTAVVKDSKEAVA
ncbi:peptidyl-prolyl cis-trans isomerase E-like [Hylaeus volcanicus]|uniref:peptidyl-prolyl cis-trans isomerase E-like n=1 Tax=Hylaeus volcanicus TaxID=313075 RepID=UPI0023B80B47|nr:peptidyl-prolyl cis-trans isomerase E-like [Hylaeus volcanicus]